MIAEDKTYAQGNCFKHISVWIKNSHLNVPFALRAGLNENTQQEREKLKGYLQKCGIANPTFSQGAFQTYSLQEVLIFLEIIAKHHTINGNLNDVLDYLRAQKLNQ